jgi:DNA modification methylase
MIGNEFHRKRFVEYGGTEKYWGERQCNKEKQGIITDEGHYGRYPSTILSFPIDKSSPDEEKAGTRTNSMIDFFILTYTNPNDIVLDITMNTGITISRCKLLGRKSIGIDISEKYCEISARRCSQAVMVLNP